MFPPTRNGFWHGFAQRRAAVFNGFAMGLPDCHCFRAGHRQSSPGLRSLRCYPSPSYRSGPSQAGPSLLAGQGCADCVRPARNCFQIRSVAVESAAITTNARGSIQCRSRLSSSPFSPRRLPAVCRTQRLAAWQAQPPARWWPMRSTRTWSPARHLAGLPGSQLAASNWACRPAARATERLIERAAFGRVDLTPGTIRADRPGGPFAFRLGGADV